MNRKTLVKAARFLLVAVCLAAVLTSRSMKVISCKFREEQVLISSLPLNQLSKDLYDLSKRNMMTDGLASCYPFISYELCDPTGILLGTSTQNIRVHGSRIPQTAGGRQNENRLTRASSHILLCSQTSP